MSKIHNFMEIQSNPPVPTSKLTSSAAVLLVTDVLASADHYRDKLGFSYDRFYGEPPAFCIVHRDGCYLMLAKIDDVKYIVPHWTVREKTCNVYFWVTDANALHREFVGRGANIDCGPCDQPYGCREFGIQDLDGYHISFGQIMPMQSDAK